MWHCARGDRSAEEVPRRASELTAQNLKTGDIAYEGIPGQKAP